MSSSLSTLSPSPSSNESKTSTSDPSVSKPSKKRSKSPWVQSKRRRKSQTSAPAPLTPLVVKDLQGRKDLQMTMGLFKDMILEKYGTTECPFKLKDDEVFVFFSFGSMVIINLKEEKDPSEWTYQPQKDSDYPDDRFVNRKEMIQSWEEYKNIFKTLVEYNPDHALILKAAYRRLLDAGYPAPGGCGADSSPLFFGCIHREDEEKKRQHYGLVASEFNDSIISLGYSKFECPTSTTPETSHLCEKMDTMKSMNTFLSCREMRRYDYMLPRPAGMINSKKEMILFRLQSKDETQNV